MQTTMLKLLRDWAEAIQEYTDALDKVRQVLVRAQLGDVDFAVFQAAFREVNELGGTGFFDGSPLNFDQLYCSLQDGKLWDPKCEEGDCSLSCPDCGQSLQVQDACLECGWKLSDFESNWATADQQAILRQEQEEC